MMIAAFLFVLRKSRILWAHLVHPVHLDQKAPVVHQARVVQQVQAVHQDHQAPMDPVDLLAAQKEA